MPVKLTPERRKKLIDAVSLGSPRRFSAGCAGISVSTLTNWLERGRREWREWEECPDEKAQPSELASFAIAFDVAEAQYVVAVLGKIRTLGEGAVKKDASKIAPTWQSLAWLLERKFPEEFGSGAAEMRELRERVREVLEAQNRGAGRKKK